MVITVIWQPWRGSKIQLHGSCQRFDYIMSGHVCASRALIEPSSTARTPLDNNTPQIYSLMRQHPQQENCKIKDLKYWKIEKLKKWGGKCKNEIVNRKMAGVREERQPTRFVDNSITLLTSSKCYKCIRPIEICAKHFFKKVVPPQVLYLQRKLSSSWFYIRNPNWPDKSRQGTAYSP